MRVRDLVARLSALVPGRSPWAILRKSPFIVLLLVLVLSSVMGLGVAKAVEGPSPWLSAADVATTDSAIGTVDPITPEYELGQQLYLENCATCHIAIPPAVLPSESWRQLLLTTEHYGVVIPTLFDPTLSLVWNYLRDYSRGLNEGEQEAYRLGESRYFKALHPQVDLPNPVRLTGCVTCHPGADHYDFRSLTPEWE